MKLDWMGRYRELVRALVYYSNNSNHNTSDRPKNGEFGLISQNEYQTLEYIVEFEDENRIMADISRSLGILPSQITKITKNLLALGLIERYHIEGNRKNIVLKPTDKGRKLYINIYRNGVEQVFKPFFGVLDSMPDESLAEFERAIKLLGENWGNLSDSNGSNEKLIKF